MLKDAIVRGDGRHQNVCIEMAHNRSIAPNAASNDAGNALEDQRNIALKTSAHGIIAIAYIR
jgi:hypothetical protein